MNLRQIVLDQLELIRPDITNHKVTKLAEQLKCSYPTMLKYLQGEGEKISFYQAIFDHFKNK
jgi:hypothetical protein